MNSSTRFLVWGASIALAIAPVLAMAPLAKANPEGLTGSYLGATVGSGDFNDSFRSLVRTGNSALWLVDQVINSNNPRTTPGQAAPSDSQFQGRIDLPSSPLSIRGTLVLNNEIEAVMPGVTYDLPVGNSANVYAGAGYAIVRPGAQTPLGDRDGLVITTGVEASVGRSIVIYGDVRYRPSQTPANENMQMQLGIGHRF